MGMGGRRGSERKGIEGEMEREERDGRRNGVKARGAGGEEKEKRRRK